MYIYESVYVYHTLRKVRYKDELAHGRTWLRKNAVVCLAVTHGALQN